MAQEPEEAKENLKKLKFSIELKRRPKTGIMSFATITEALSLLLKLDEATFKIPEPIPYDGSVLHAFERIVPQIVNESGYKIKRVYTKGTKW